MDTRTGEIVDARFVNKMSYEERKHFVPVVRDLTAKERSDNQIKLYGPCGCGSGKKFKFCCFKK